MAIAEGNHDRILLIVHNVQQTFSSQGKIYSIDVVLVPAFTFCAVIFEVFVAFSDVVGGYVCVEMVNVVVLDSIAECFEEFGDLEVGASFESCPSEFPLWLTFSIGLVDSVLQVEKHVSYNKCSMYAEIHGQRGNSQQIKNPIVQDKAEEFLEN